MAFDFPLVTRQRKVLFILKIIFLVAIVFGRYYEILGTYLPVQIWEVLTVYLVASIILNLVRFFAITAYRRRCQLPVGERDNFVLGVDSLVALVVFVVTAVSLFSIFDVALQTFLTSISLFAVALVLIFRDYISNFLDSFRLMFSTDFQIGDYIKASEFTKGFIIDISFRATKLKTDNGDVLYIPNTKLITSEVVNYSKTKFKRIVVPFTVPTSSIPDVTVFEENLKTNLQKALPDLVVEKKMYLKITDIHDWQTVFSFEVSVDQYNFSIEERVSKVVYQLVLAEQKNTVTPTNVMMQNRQS
jgi:small-conductance mechanosensitive channel